MKGGEWTANAMCKWGQTKKNEKRKRGGAKTVRAKARGGGQRPENRNPNVGLKTVTKQTRELKKGGGGEGGKVRNDKKGVGES